MAMKKAAKKKAAKKTPTKKLIYAKKVAKKSATGTATPEPTLKITLVDEDNFHTNQDPLDPPHVCRSLDGGFPHQVQFEAVVAVSVCLPPGNFENVPNYPIPIAAGGKSDNFRVKRNASVGSIEFSYTTKGTCSYPAPGSGGESIIIDP